MRILVTGDRDWGVTGDRELLERAVCMAPDGSVFVHGACSKLLQGQYEVSADMLADHYARYHGYRAEPHPAEWHSWGRAAGPIRNQQMLDSGVDAVWAFHTDLPRSRGTYDMVDRALRRFRRDGGPRVVLWTGSEDAVYRCDVCGLDWHGTDTYDMPCPYCTARAARLARRSSTKGRTI